MNRLQLAQRLALECGVSGTLSTTLSQTAGLGRLVTWIDQAWQNLQNKHDNWEWMRSSNMLGAGASFATVNGTSSYPLGTGAGTCGVLAANFTKWDPTTFRNYNTAAGTKNEIFMDPVPYDTWRNVYMYSANRDVRTRPIAIAVGPDKSLCLGPVPNGDYTVTGDYFTAPTAMAADTDTPTGLPIPFHMIIVYDAMRMYAGYEGAPEVWSRAETEYGKAIRELESKYLPQFTWSGALA